MQVLSVLQYYDEKQDAKIDDRVPELGDLIRSLKADQVDQMSDETIVEYAGLFFRPGSIMKADVRDKVIEKLKKVPENSL